MNSTELSSLISNPENHKICRVGKFMNIKRDYEKNFLILQKISIYQIKAKVRYLFGAFFYTCIISMSFYFFLSFNFSKISDSSEKNLTLFHIIMEMLNLQDNYNQVWFGNYITASAALFIGIFVYRYTLFNNKWKYAADLYNKLYIDQFNSENQLDFFRKRCLLAQDILKMNLQDHPTFNYEISQTIIMAAIIYQETNEKKEKEIYSMLRKNESIRMIFLLEQPDVILRNVIIKTEDAIYKKSQTSTKTQIATDFQNATAEFQKQYLIIQDLKKDIENLKSAHQEFNKLAL